MPKARTEDGVDINYRIDDFRDPWIADPGETIVMSHGFVRSTKWWTQWVPALSRKYRVVRYDVRGCGESSAPPEDAPWTGDRIVKDALNVVDHLGIEKIHWVGFESGGMWGNIFAINHPDRIKSLTTLNTPATGTGRTATQMPEVGKRGSGAVQEMGLRQWLNATNKVRMDPAMQDPKMMEWHINEQSKTPKHVAVGILKVYEGIDLSESYSKIQVPTLMMLSENAPNCPLEEQIPVRRKIPNGRLVVFPGVGAGVQLLHPDWCVAEVLRFLEGL